MNYAEYEPLPEVLAERLERVERVRQRRLEMVATVVAKRNLRKLVSDYRGMSDFYYDPVTGEILEFQHDGENPQFRIPSHSVMEHIARLNGIEQGTIGLQSSTRVVVSNAQSSRAIAPSSDREQTWGEYFASWFN